MSRHDIAVHPDEYAMRFTLTPLAWGISIRCPISGCPWHQGWSHQIHVCVSDLIRGARTHLIGDHADLWQLPEVYVPKHAKREDGDGEAVPAVDPAVGDAEAGEQAEHGGDDVQDDLQDGHSPVYTHGGEGGR